MTWALDNTNFNVLFLVRSSGESFDDDMDNDHITQLVIITQVPPISRKHSGGDRTGNYTSRSKLSVNISQTISDGLYFYEKVSIILCSVWFYRV